MVAHNIAVGHVILASGQSNMLISLADIRSKYPKSNWAALAQQSIANAPKNRAVRLFKVRARPASQAVLIDCSRPTLLTGMGICCVAGAAGFLGRRQSHCSL